MPIEVWEPGSKPASPPIFICDEMTIEKYLDTEQNNKPFSTLTGGKAHTQTAVVRVWYEQGKVDWDTVRRVADFSSSVEEALIPKLSPQDRCAYLLFSPRGLKDLAYITDIEKLRDGDGLSAEKAIEIAQKNRKIWLEELRSFVLPNLK